eukprot:12881836-Prorocentrum_lima.AAC.1
MHNLTGSKNACSPRKGRPASQPRLCQQTRWAAGSEQPVRPWRHPVLVSGCAPMPGGGGAR